MTDGGAEPGVFVGVSFKAEQFALELVEALDAEKDFRLPVEAAAQRARRFDVHDVAVGLSLAFYLRLVDVEPAGDGLAMRVLPAGRRAVMDAAATAEGR